MNDYIERDAAIKAITALSILEKPEDINRAVEQERRKENEWLGGIRDALVEIGTMDAADVRPVVRGEMHEFEYGKCLCSECGQVYSKEFAAVVNYCVKCGAEMRRESND